MKLLDFIVCDDIRQELGGKQSLMGVFGDSIIIQIPKGAPRPFPFRMALFFRVLLEETDPVPDSFKATIRLGDTDLGTFEGGIKSSGRPRMLGFPLPLNAVPISGSTKLSFRASFFAAGRELYSATPPYETSIELMELDAIQLVGGDAPAERRP